MHYSTGSTEPSFTIRLSTKGLLTGKVYVDYRIKRHTPLPVLYIHSMTNPGTDSLTAYVIVKFLLFKEGYLVEMPTLLMFLMFTVVFSNGVVKLSEISVGDLACG